VKDGKGTARPAINHRAEAHQACWSRLHKQNRGR